MNQKTAKLLTRYAAFAKKKLREVKREWAQQDHLHRAAQRRAMKREIGE